MSSVVREPLAEMRELSKQARQKEKVFMSAFKAYFLAVNEVSRTCELSVVFTHPEYDFYTDVTLYNGNISYSQKPSRYNQKPRRINESMENFVQNLRYPKVTLIEKSLEEIEKSSIGKIITSDMVNKYLDKI
ncbi:hypothetical protein EPN87_00540 [archaeon]|nr:MAG: hypothetical protein EPN87_00540 [archaeon]